MGNNKMDIRKLRFILTIAVALLSSIISTKVYASFPDDILGLKPGDSIEKAAKILQANGIPFQVDGKNNCRNLIVKDFYMSNNQAGFGMNVTAGIVTKIKWIVRSLNFDETVKKYGVPSREYGEKGKNNYSPVWNRGDYSGSLSERSDVLTGNNEFSWGYVFQLELIYDGIVGKKVDAAEKNCRTRNLP